MEGFEVFLALVVLVTVVSAVADRLRVPEPVALVLAGLVIGLLPGVPDFAVDPTFVQSLILPPLLYVAALELSPRELRDDAAVIGLLVIGLVLVTSLAVGGVVVAVTELPLAVGVVLGTILAATDLVAVTALARQLHLPRRLVTIVKGESLLNDATALVAYRVAVTTVVAGGGLSLAGAGRSLAVLTGGGIAIGLAVGAVVALIRGRIDDPIVENALSLVTPFAALLPAEALGTSGVMAVVTCGLFLSPRAASLVSTSGRLQTAAVWRMIVFLLEGTVFLLVGFELPGLVAALGQDRLGVVAATVLTLLVTLLVARFAWIFTATYVPRIVSPGLRARSTAPPWQYPAVLAWAGARGVVALAAALALPLTTADGTPFPGRDLVLVLTAGVILASLVVQGLSLGPIVRRLGLRADTAVEQQEETLAHNRAARAALAALDGGWDETDLPQDVLDRLRSGLEERVRRTAARLRAPEAHATRTSEVFRRLRRDLLQVEREEVIRLRDAGEIGDTVSRTVLRALDLEETALGD